jgi:hypothetical protein
MFERNDLFIVYVGFGVAMLSFLAIFVILGIHVWTTSLHPGGWLVQ